MEIISYVGAASAVQAEPKRLHVPKPHFERRRAFTAKTKSPLEDALNPRRLLRLSFYKWLVPTLAICILVPVTVFRAADYLETHANPVVFASLPDAEIAFLNSAMARFAIERTDDAFDENGNVLADDGSVLTAASVGIAQAVSFSTYTVKAGDTISGIARKFGLTNISTLIGINNIENVRTLWAGQKLRVPSMDGLIHRVGKGDTLNSLSVKYKVSVEELADANDMDASVLSVGQEIFIPGARMDATALKKAMGELFAYPIKAQWRLTSRFGIRNDPFTGVKSSHTGIDMACPTGTPIYATMSGTVVVAGWSNVFGNYVVINHDGNGYQTLYGHMSKRIAQKGQRVNQGTKIGLVGSTGYSTGPHLHFTVYKNGKLVDPLTLLK